MLRTDETILRLFEKYPALEEEQKSEIWESFEILLRIYNNSKKALIAGNGGSAADSEHIVGEFMKGFCKKRPLEGELAKKLRHTIPSEIQHYYLSQLQTPLEAISLSSQMGLITAFANDVNADLIYAQQVLGYGKEGDVLIVLTTSGNSKNVIHAAWVARALGMKTIAFTGGSGGEIANIVDVSIVVPAETTLEIQEYHLPIYHALCKAVEAELFRSE